MIKGMGSGYTEINHFDDSGTPLYPQEEYKKIRDTILDEITHKRGDFIARCIDVDNTLGDAIKWFFCKNDKIKGKAFTELILNQQFFAFGKKKEVIKSLINKYPESYPTIAERNDGQIFFTKLDSIIENRNLLAHGELIIDFRAKQAKISKYYLYEQESKTKELSQDYFENLQNDISWIINYCFYHLIFPDGSIPVDENYEIIWEELSR